MSIETSIHHVSAITLERASFPANNGTEAFDVIYVRVQNDAGGDYILKLFVEPGRFAGVEYDEQRVCDWHAAAAEDIG